MPLRLRESCAEVQHDLEIPVDIDDELGLTELKQHRGAELLLNTDQSSHIHFAACGARQKAIEEDGRGWFTAELLKKLREKRVDKTTYHNLLRFLSLPKEQSPQCYGKHKNRIFFDSRVPSHNVTFIRAEYNPEEASWNLEAGAASGVTLESTWELHKSPHEDSELVGRFKVKKLYGSSAVLKPLATRHLSLATGENVLYAQFKKHGSRDELVLKVWASPGAQNHLFPGPDRHLGSTHNSGVGYRMVSTRDTADVALDIHDAEATEPDIVFYWCDVTSRKYSLEKLKHRKPANREKVEAVLFATAQWRWHLQRTNASEDQSLTMSMLKVATRISTRPRATREYLGKPESIIVENGVADLVTNSTALYGFKLQNKLNLSLYVRLFYFDATNFSIGDMFGHNVGSGEVGANIFPRSQLLIGDGADGGAPLKFDVSSNNEVELGYVKVFWSTEPLELDIEQESAFLGEPRAVSSDSDSSDSKWGTICLPIVLRGKRSS
ncbi:hypothetical protein BN14_07733 [Rhizoctonia solani AG-1 IB]|uniref:Uncharacterized protein n=1 Tax=Thanatephorus cucumeris (strain AG1-IB / isolate 7/3/14) TaxID=1108050 RepID=M5C0Z9_THACB|nr:hypothetical protein BN14_07733 [Rhizoctonia solani AG-1 IB]